MERKLVKIKVPQYFFLAALLLGLSSPIHSAQPITSEWYEPTKLPKTSTWQRAKRYYNSLSPVKKAVLISSVIIITAALVGTTIYCLRPKKAQKNYPINFEGQNYIARELKISSNGNNCAYKGLNVSREDIATALLGAQLTRDEINFFEPEIKILAQTVAQAKIAGHSDQEIQDTYTISLELYEHQQFKQLVESVFSDDSSFAPSPDLCKVYTKSEIAQSGKSMNLIPNVDRTHQIDSKGMTVLDWIANQTGKNLIVWKYDNSLQKLVEFHRSFPTPGPENIHLIHVDEEGGHFNRLRLSLAPGS